MRAIILETGKGRVYYVAAKTLATWLPAVMWKVENILNELGDIVKEISSQRVLFFPHCL